MNKKLNSFTNIIPVLLALLLLGIAAGQASALPVISGLAVSPSSGTANVSDTITLNITADQAGYTPSSIYINSVDVTNSNFQDLTGGNYSVDYVVQSSDPDVSEGAIAASVILSNGTDTNVEFTTMDSNSLAVDAGGYHLDNLSSSAVANNTDKFMMILTATRGSTFNLKSNRSQDTFDVSNVTTNNSGKAIFNITSTLAGRSEITANGTNIDSVNLTDNGNVLFVAGPTPTPTPTSTATPTPTPTPTPTSTATPTATPTPTPMPTSTPTPTPSPTQTPIPTNTPSITGVNITPTIPSTGSEMNITVAINNPGVSFNGRVEGNVWAPDGSGKYLGWDTVVIPFGASTVTITGAAGGNESSYIPHQAGAYLYDVFLENVDMGQVYTNSADSRLGVPFTVGAASSVYISNVSLSASPTNGSVMALKVTISNPTASAFNGTMDANVWDSASGHVLTPQNISIAAGSSTTLTFSYTPVNQGLHSYDFFMVSDVSGQNTKVPWGFLCMDYVAGIGFTVV
jgi:hypothetical protein